MVQAQLLKDIRQIVKSETLEIVQRETRNIVKEELEEIVGRKVAPMRKDLKKIRKDLEFEVGELDMNSNALEKRVKRIEFHLGLST